MTGDLFGDAPPAPSRPRPRTSSPDPQARVAWFFALRPAAEDAVRLDDLARRLRASHGVAKGVQGADRLHVSLDPVGDDVDRPVLEAACRAADAVRMPAFDVRFDAAVSYAGPSGPFVLVGGDGLEAVRSLRLALACALADQGFKPKRQFEPHMTLAYDADRRVGHTPIAPIAFRATEFALVKSHVGFSRHEVLRAWPLAG